MSESIDSAHARRAAVLASGLGMDFESGENGVLGAIRHLSSVQIDTLSVVERAHHHILWSRVPRYARSHLDRLEGKPRRIIEYWSHAAAYLPIDEYRYCIPRMERVRTRGHDWFKVDSGTVALVRERIRAEGPLRAQDFEGPTRGTRGWWDWKPAKQALEYLFHAGELVSLGREGFQKRFELAERALPKGLDLRTPSSGEMAAHYVDTAERTLGIFTQDDVAYHRSDLVDGVPEEIAQRVESGALVALSVNPAGGKKTWYAAAERMKLVTADGAVGPRAFLLSPFDPLLIDRRRTKRLFGVEVQIECYLPAQRRRFGYFALPILFRDGSGEVTIAGRLDAKADREASSFQLRRMELSGVAGRRRASFASSLVAEIRRYAKFSGCDRVQLVLLEAEDRSLEAAVRGRLEALADFG